MHEAAHHSGGYGSARVAPPGTGAVALVDQRQAGGVLVERGEPDLQAGRYVAAHIDAARHQLVGDGRARVDDQQPVGAELVDGAGHGCKAVGAKRLRCQVAHDERQPQPGRHFDGGDAEALQQPADVATGGGHRRHDGFVDAAACRQAAQGVVDRIVHGVGQGQTPVGKQRQLGVGVAHVYHQLGHCRH